MVINPASGSRRPLQRTPLRPLARQIRRLPRKRSAARPPTRPRRNDRCGAECRRRLLGFGSNGPFPPMQRPNEQVRVRSIFAQLIAYSGWTEIPEVLYTCGECMPQPETNRKKVVARLARDGWVGRRGGDQDVYKHPTRPGRIIVPRHRALSPGEARAIAKVAGW